MSGNNTFMRYYPYGARVGTIAFALVALAMSGTPCKAADSSTLSQLNRQIAATLASDSQVALRPAFAPAPAITPDYIQAAGVANSNARPFVLPAWIVPFAHIDRLMHVHAGDLEFDGWGVLRRGGSIRLKYTLRL